MAEERFSITIRLVPEDIDMLGHVNNLVYLRWVQEAAMAHWSTIAPVDEQEKLIRIIRRHEIDYKRPALLGGTVLVRTWIGNASRFAFDRHTEILHASNLRPLAIVRTVLCPIDRKNGRPTDISPAIRELFAVESIK
ncbi:thioesterase family protein [Chlorobium sp. KB01]|uniref:acyl-CoA thioesterase n=1 Tax=Chlorobium sp. KB01 TaxID=1917528 RepID=UPI000977702C|nr:thioesterase family protein [Chlorobium sp. KB01]